MFSPVAGEEKLEPPYHPSRRGLEPQRTTCKKLPRDPNLAIEDHKQEGVASRVALIRSGEVLEYHPSPLRKGVLEELSASTVLSLKDIISEDVDLVRQQGLFEGGSLGGELELLFLECS